MQSEQEALVVYNKTLNVYEAEQRIIRPRFENSTSEYKPLALAYVSTSADGA